MFFFFFKQKTAYDIRISDWSSDVCSSDLVAGCPCNADVCPSGVVAFAVHSEEAMAGAVLISVGHDVLLHVCRRIIPSVHGESAERTNKPGIKGSGAA